VIFRLLLATIFALTPGESQIPAQATGHSPAFEVASIRENLGPWHVLLGYSASGPRLTLEAYSPGGLIMEAYGLKGYQISYAASVRRPDQPEYYDIAAKAEGSGSPTRGEFRQMLQALLADRFRLAVHREMREMPVYALVVGKNGTKFPESKPESQLKRFHGVNGRNQYMDYVQATMEMVADGIDVDRPVVDKTGLTGKYDIRLEATPEFRIRNNPQPDDLSIFDAIQQQLGLRLEAQKSGVEVLVVDHIEKPSAN
jgi:uncharacterized protein (TIGR03435 family)